jgi:hypothetical protein
MRQGGERLASHSVHMYSATTGRTQMPDLLQVTSAQVVSQLEKCQEQLAAFKDEIAALKFPAVEKWHSSDINALAILMHSLVGQLASAAPSDRPIRVAEALLLLAKCAYFSDPPGLTNADRQAISTRN